MYGHLSPGTRVRLTALNDAHSTLPLGTEGTVARWDRFGGLDVKWDNGSRLGILPDCGDRVDVIG